MRHKFGMICNQRARNAKFVFVGILDLLFQKSLKTVEKLQIFETAEQLGGVFNRAILNANQIYT